MILLRPLDPLYKIGYQFIPAFGPQSYSNGHFLFVWKESPLAVRILQAIIKFPFDAPMRHPRIAQTHIYNWLYNDAMPYYVFENNGNPMVGHHERNHYWYPLSIILSILFWF